MKGETNFWDQAYFSLAKKVLSQLGQWPYQSKNELRIHRFLLFMMYSFQIIPQIAATIIYSDDIEVILESASSFLVDLAILINILTSFFQLNKMKILLERIKQDWTILSKDNELRLLVESCALGRKISILYSGGVLFATMLYITEPLHLRLLYFFVKSNVSLPKNFSTPMYFGPIDGEKHYYTLLLISGMCITAIVTVIVATDLLFFIYAQHTCGLFAALGFTLANLPTKKHSWRNANKYEYEYLRRCVQLHNRAIEFSAAIEDIYVWNFFGLIGLNMIVISITTVQVVMNQGAVQKLLKAGAFTMGQISHLFIQCLMAQRITDSSLGVQQSMYIQMNSKWYYSTAKARQLITFMTMISQNPCQLTAGKVMFMSLNTFSSIIRTSVTYFTVFMDMK